MIISHAPTGYLLYQVLPESWKNHKTFLATLVGSVAPDFDLLINIFGLSNLNHRYFISHTPYVWILAYLAILTLYRTFSTTRPWIHAFFFGTFIHLILDIPTGIQVFYPLSTHMVDWFPLVYSSSLSPFQHFLHPYVITDILLCYLAYRVFRQNRVRTMNPEFITTRSVPIEKGGANTPPNSKTIEPLSIE